MSAKTLVSGDIQYLSWYLYDKDPDSGSLTPHDLTNADTITFRLRVSGSTVNVIECTCGVVTANLGFCSARVTIPVVNVPTLFVGEIEVKEAGGLINTWKGVYYQVEPQLG